MSKPRLHHLEDAVVLGIGIGGGVGGFFGSIIAYLWVALPRPGYDPSMNYNGGIQLLVCCWGGAVVGGTLGLLIGAALYSWRGNR